MRITQKSGATKLVNRNPLLVHVGIRLHKLRQKYQITMRQLSDDTGLSAAFICDIENGKTAPSIVTMMKLSRYFEVPLGYFIRGFNDK